MHDKSGQPHQALAGIYAAQAGGKKIGCVPEAG